MQHSFAFVKAVDKRTFMQISKEVIEGLYQTQLLQTKDILSFIGTEIIDDYFMLVWSTDADGGRNS